MAKKKAKKRPVKKIGAFIYDLFPYCVTHTVKKITDEGNIECDGFTMGVSALLAIKGGKRGLELQEAVSFARCEYDRRMNDTKDELWEDLIERFPELKRAKAKL